MTTRARHSLRSSSTPRSYMPCIDAARSSSVGLRGGSYGEWRAAWETLRPYVGEAAKSGRLRPTYW